MHDYKHPLLTFANDMSQYFPWSYSQPCSTPLNSSDVADCRLINSFWLITQIIFTFKQFKPNLIWKKFDHNLGQIYIFNLIKK